MIRVEVKGIDGVRGSLRRLQSDLRDKALAMAINKTAAKAQTEITRAVTEEFAISRDEVRNSMYLRPATTKRQYEVEAVIQIFGSAKRKGRSLNVSHFLEKSITLAEARRRNKRGALYAQGKGGRLFPILGFKFKRGGGVKHIDGAFIGNKGRTVFVRVGKGRLPIKPVQMIGVSQMFSSRRIHYRVLAKIKADLEVEVRRAVEALLAKRG
jgi:hypothetical protein